MRALAVILALVLAFAAAVMITAMLDINDKPRCDDPAGLIAYQQSHPNARHVTCFDGSQVQQSITVIVGIAGGAVAGIAAILALAFTIRGTNGRRVLWATALAIVLSGLSILIGSI